MSALSGASDPPPSGRWQGSRSMLDTGSKRHEQSSVNIAVNQLAENSGKETITGKLPGVPFLVMMLILIIPVLGLSIIPTCVIVFQTSTESVDILATNIISGVVNDLGGRLTGTFNQLAMSVNMYMTFPELYDLLTTKTRGYGVNFERLNQISIEVIDNTPFLNTLICIQRANLTGEVPTNTNFTQTCSIGYRYVENSVPALMVGDYSNLTFIHEMPFDKITGITGVPQPVYWITPTTVSHAFIYDGVMNNCSAGPRWINEIAFGLPRFTYARCAFKRIEKFKDPPYTCGLALSADDQFTKIFLRLTPTRNTRLFLANEKNELIVTNQNVSVANDQGTAFLHLNEARDPVIAEIGSILLAQNNNNLKNIPYFDLSKTSHAELAVRAQHWNLKSDNNREWVTTVVPLSFLSTDLFYLVISIPRNDFFGSVDYSKTVGIIITAVFASVGCVACVLVVFTVTIPLRKMIVNMQKVSQFDFQMLESGVFREDSVLKEVRVLENAFNTMVKAFAGGIRQNKTLGGRSLVLTSTSTPGN